MLSEICIQTHYCRIRKRIWKCHVVLASVCWISFQNTCVYIDRRGNRNRFGRGCWSNLTLERSLVLCGLTGTKECSGYHGFIGRNEIGEVKAHLFSRYDFPKLINRKWVCEAKVGVVHLFRYPAEDKSWISMRALSLSSMFQNEKHFNEWTTFNCKTSTLCCKVGQIGN